MSTSNKNTTSTKRKIPIDYTKKGFSEIKEDLQSYIKRNYPDTYKDFNKSSFGSMMLDLVSYIGDQLHYYLDHNANESNPHFAKEAENVIQGLTSLGAKVDLYSSSEGYVDIYVPIPADNYGVGVDTSYICTLLKGSKYKTQGGSVYTQSRDEVINPEVSEIIGHKSTADGSKILYFLLKTRIAVHSGEEKQFTVEFTGDEKNKEIEIPDQGVLGEVKVVDAEGREYFEANNLTSDVALQTIVDNNQPGTSTGNTRIVKKPIPRRFVKRKTLNKTFLTFGYGSESEETTNSSVDPIKVASKFAGKKSITVPRQDPFNILNSNGLGIAPSNTTLTITYRTNSNVNSNAAVGTVNQIVEPLISFKNEQLLDENKVSYIRENMQVYNEEPINGFVSIPSTEELKHRYLGNYSAQGRAVTMQDYVSAVYAMDGGLGAVKRAAIVRDTNDFRRNLNLYLISEGANGKLEAPSMLLKQNVKTWIDSMRMVSDSVDIFDANIINLALDIRVKIASTASAQTSLIKIKQKLYEELMTIPPDIGQNFSISEVYRILRQIPEIVTISPGDGVRVRNLVGAGKYSDYSYDIAGNMSNDQETIYIPDNTIWEIKYLDDITGTIIS